MNAKNEPSKVNKPFFFFNLVKQATIAPLETQLQKRKKAQRSRAMAKQSSPLPAISITPLTLLKVFVGNSSLGNTGPEDTPSVGLKSEVEQLIGNFMTWHG